MSKMEDLLLSRDFPYLQPYFYNNPWAMRCELGRGRTAEEFERSARARAEAICRILFPRGADAVIFNSWIYDHAYSGGPGEDNPGASEAFRSRLLEQQIRREAELLRFLDAMQRRYRHAVIRDLPTGEEGPDKDCRRSRVFCWRDGGRFDEPELLERQLREEPEPLEIGLVSFEHECVLSVYDCRGCDLVFAGPEQFLALYSRLEPFFLDYDRAELARRYGEALCLKKSDPSV